MKQREDQMIEVNSTFEARMISRAAALAANDGSKEYTIRHADIHDRRISLAPLYSGNQEVDFHKQDKAYGQLVVSKGLSARAIEGLRLAEKRQRPFNELTPEIAKVMVDLWNGRPVDEATAPPALTESELKQMDEVREARAIETEAALTLLKKILDEHRVRKTVKLENEYQEIGDEYQAIESADIEPVIYPASTPVS